MLMLPVAEAIGFLRAPAAEVLNEQSQQHAAQLSLPLLLLHCCPVAALFTSGAACSIMITIRLLHG
jgi:hypothetical protein